MHQFTSLLTVCLMLSALANADDEVKKTTAVYKQVGDLEIKADVYRADNSKVMPVVVWIHGGALINGHREGVSGNIKRWAAENDCALISIDYRLAPETKLPAIIEDVEDAFKWIRGDGAKRFKLDTSRIVVSGGSAGGYLTLTVGFRVKPRVQGLVAFWGYGGLVGDWYSKPSPHARHKGVETKEQAWKNVSGPAISDSRDRKGNGGTFYRYCRRLGSWPTAVSDGWDPLKNPEKFYPYMPVKNVTQDYPETLMIHGTKDTDVPHDESVMMARELKSHGVKHKLISIEGGEHGLGGGERKKINAAHAASLEFIARHLGKTGNKKSK
jgi:acetyl esterase/lipase